MREVFVSRTSLLSIALAVSLAACGDPQDLGPDDLMESGDSAQNSNSNSNSTEPVRSEDAGQALPDAAVSAADAGTTVSADASSVEPRKDAGSERNDAGNEHKDAGHSERDASAATTDAGGASCATLSYASFGMQFMTTYCTSCHTGAGAKHGVQLDTLAGVQKSKDAIKRTTVAGTNMPMGAQGAQLSASDRQKLGQWLDCGPN